jgi:hypothetical protein
MRLMRDEPQGIMIEPMPERGAAHMRNFWQVADGGAAVEATHIEASAFAQLWAILRLAEVTHGGQDGCGRRFADARQRHKALEIWTWRQEFDGVVEPPLVFRQSVGQVVCQRCELKRLDAVGVFEADA